MESQIEQVLADKIIQSAELGQVPLTRRSQGLPRIIGKAFAAIGMRRAGKTTWLHQCRNDLMEQGRTSQRLIYINFEDERLANLSGGDLGQLLDIHSRLFPEALGAESGREPLTLFLDEIQLVPGWERFVRRLLDTPDHEVFISGSSAKLLSREIASSMRGRAWEVEIFPFSFQEHLRHADLPNIADIGLLSGKRRAEFDGHFARYLKGGGFPEAHGLDLPDRLRLLQGYVDVVILRDVIERHEVSSPTALRWLVRRLLSAPGGLFSITKVHADLKSQGLQVSRETLYELMDHLHDAYLVHPLSVATDSEKRRQVNPRKIYSIDPGLIPVFDLSSKANIGHALECSVFIELRRRGAEVAYVKTARGFEVDFLARYLDGREQLIQVSVSIDDNGTREREIRALLDAADEFQGAEKVLLTLEGRMPYPSVPDNITVMPAWEWMANGG